MNHRLSSFPQSSRSVWIALLVSFSRSQVSSVLATAVDFGVLLFSVELLGIWYVVGTALGAISGALVSFLLGRQWAFEASGGAWKAQAVRYGLVSGSSLLLNVAGVFWFTEWFALRYSNSKILVALLVGVFFNFPMHRYFVFQKKESLSHE